eukprot:CAMPEP_0172307200 /NCGR_PEP_ID=MMETSP1058-20130122/8102_1 /TAXON_ID=83371 /ORGANISM="Detonula confervacea, Strain CCMP 353" /LENGTH=927 /DNA_ID=CAMNT_0013019297 /DNA_START=10 /DNA_END=2793 /DNA_ORIENTATION=-
MDQDKSNDEVTNEMDEKRFLRMFSKELAEALRAKDEEEAEERERLRTKSGNTRSSGRDDETKQWERIRSTYVELCHDEPVVSGGDGDCRHLAKTLIPKQHSSNKTPGKGKDKNANKLALCSRLVDGVVQATSRAGAKATTSSSTSSNTTQNNQKNAADTEQESMFGPSNITTSEGYAEIAFAMFVEGPYRCIQQADNLQTTSSFLGTFQPPDTSHVQHEKLDAEEKSRLVDEATAKIVSGIEKMSMEGKDTETKKNAANGQDDASSSSSEFSLPNTAQDAQQRIDDDNDPMKEVFAEESDADDYEYGSYTSPSDGQTIFGQKTSSDEYDDMHDLSFNPLQLSEPNATNCTWEGARKSIHYLLSSISYGKLALGSLSSRAWSEGGMSETLADLCFMLLLETTNNKDQGDTAKPNSLLHHGQDGSEDIDALWDRPLFLLRDRALDKNHGHDALPSYLQLLTAFLSHSEDVMSVLTPPLGTSTSENILPPATSVGLSSFATFCSSKEMISASSGRMCGTSMWSVCPREEMKKAILSSLDSLARIVECVRPRESIFAKKPANPVGNESTSANNPWIRTAVCIIPIIEYLTNLQARFDFQPLFEGGGNRSATLSESDAKAISDSGLFREMLSMYINARNVNETSASTKPNAEDVVRMQLLRTIFTLSAQSPEVLGRYAVRVPAFAKEVHSSSFMENNLVDGILWTSIGSSLLENKSDAPKPRLKLRANSKLATKAPIEAKSLAERHISGFGTMCETSKTALEDLKQFVKIAEGQVLSDEEKRKYDACKDALGNIKRYANCLSNCPSATKMWLESLKNKEEATPKAKANIAELKSTLASMTSFSDEEIKISHQGHKKDDDDLDAEGSEDDLASPEDEVGEKIQTLKQIRKDYGTIVASVRSSVKVISLALESRRGSGLSLDGPMSCDVSSKTD